jgi:hypothetical protein
MTIPADLHPLLTDLRRKLNRANELNLLVHQYQGDFDIGRDEATGLTEVALQQYTAYLRDEVEPLFVKLGQGLIEQTDVIVMVDSKTGATNYAVTAREWYQRMFECGVMW